ncbi:MAG TPA: hypothetical protein VHS33_04400 [Sphingomicrobium sp.]|jgi:hypothetical protein|nr:hypothetical protein [Sphingomicrobium sp.]
MNQKSAVGAPQFSDLRILPVVSPEGVSRVPLIVVFSYLIATFAIFLVWPINWPIYYLRDWLGLIGYVLLCFAVIAAAMYWGSAGATRLTAPLPHLNLLLWAGTAAAALLLVPSSFSYTGRGPWEVLDALRDQGAAYHQFQLQLYATEGQRIAIVGLRAVAAPVTFAVLPLGIIHWRTIGLSGRSAVIIAVLVSAVFSIMRGTDKEFADLFIVGCAGAFVAFGRNRMLGTRGPGMALGIWRPVLAALVFVYLAQGLSIDRKSERNGGYANATLVCANDSTICADLDDAWISWLPLPQRFGVTSFILSTTSGYFGLELALKKPFESAYGLGHSPAVLSIYEALTGDPTPHQRTYTYRNGDDQWSEDYYWSTLMTWIANDVGFVGALPVLGLIAYLWALWWREAAAGMSDPAAILFTLSTMMMFYFPANNEVLASYDGYTILSVWVVVWLWHRRAKAVSALASG